MKYISRRSFIKLTSASAVALAHSMSIHEFAEAAGQPPLPVGTPILVIVTLNGGNDGLNTVVPYSDSIYKSLRPQLAYTEEQVLPIGDGLALNGSMIGLKSLWDKNQLAIVRGVGYPNPDRSHFSSMAIWQSASRTPIKTGWIGRWIETQPENPFLAISLGTTLPALFQGEKRSGTVLPLTGLTPPTGMLASDYAKTSKKTRRDGQLSASAARSMRDLFTVAETVAPILKNPAPPAADLPTVIGGNAGGESNLSAQFETVAKLIAAGVPTRVWSVSLGGFDTHANELSAQSLLLGTVSNSISKFMSQMRTIGRSRDVTIMVYSEFGRRVRANASNGTDHGTSGPVFIIGERVVGGFHGEQPAHQ